MIAIMPERSLVDRVADNLVDGCEKMTGAHFRPYQRFVACKLIRSILLNEGREFTLVWARQIGKTQGGAYLIAGLLALIPALASRSDYRAQFPILREYRNGFHVGFVAPKIATARIPFKRLRRILHGVKQQAFLASLGITLTNASSEELALSNGSSAIALSGADTAFQEGHTFHLLWFEETQAIGQYQIRKVFEPMVAATNGTIVKVGTAGTRKCSFLDSIETNKRLSPEDHSELTWRGVIEIMRKEAPHDPWTARYEAWVRKQIEKLPGGELNEGFRMNFALEWILQSSQLIAFEQWKRLCADGLDGRPLFHRSEFTDGHRRVFGIDWAKTVDETVVTAGEEWPDHIRWLDWLALKGTTYDEQLEEIIPWCGQRGGLDWNTDPIYVTDSTGVGDPLTDLLRRLVPRVEGLTYTPQSKDGLFKLWQRRLPGERRGTQILYPPCERDDQNFKRFELQFLNCEIETKGNLIAYHHRDNEDEELGSEVQHDDYVDSGFNTLYASNIPQGRFTAIQTVAVARDPRDEKAGVSDPAKIYDGVRRMLAGMVK